MSIVTLITDFGCKDYYVPALKGNLLKSIPDVRVVDVSHEVKAHDILEAGFILKNVYSSFPKGTIHICYVKNHEENQNLIFGEFDGHYFIAPNNGLFSLVFPDLDITFYKLKQNLYMPFRELGELVKALTSNEPIDSIGDYESDVVKRIGLSAIVSKDQIRASVIHIDRYGNLIINIEQQLFERVGKSRRFKIYFKRFEPIEQLSHYYSDGQVGQVIALFNSTGNLVISVCMGNAARDLEFKKEETIQVIFE